MGPRLGNLPIYPIRTAAALTGVEPRRLRMWEVEYHLLQPARTRGHHRLYSMQDLELIRQIRRLIEEQGMSLQGVGAWLAAQPVAPDGDDELAEPSASRDVPEAAVAAGRRHNG